MKGIQEVRAAAFARLQTLDKAGNLTPRRVVQEARNPKSPLHRAWPWLWNQKAAAQKWLEQQARVLIESYRVVVTVRAVPIEHRGRVVAFIRDPRAAPDQQRYVASSRPRGKVAQEVLDHELQRIVGYVERGWGIAQQLGLETQYVTRLTALIKGLVGLNNTKVARAS